MQPKFEEKPSELNNIAALFFKAAEEYPQNIALIEGNEQIPYAELLKSVQQTAAHFISKGLQKGDRILVFVPMSIDLYRIVLAIFSIGATAVFLDEWVSLKRLELCCKIADCKAFIGSWKLHLLAIFSKELRKIPIHLNLKYNKEKSAELIRVESTDTALITFTTGSTGTPKAAKRTHAFLKAQFNALIKVLQPKSTDVDKPVLPIVLLINLGVGATSVIAKYKASKPKAFLPEHIYAQIKKHRVTRITASPYFIKQLADYCITEKADVSTIDKVFTGGAPVFRGDAKIIRKAFSAASIYVVYGSTEAEPISVISADELCLENDNELLPVGKLNEDIELRIIPITNGIISFNSNADFEAFCLPYNSVGEIIVSGPHVLKEYWNNEEAFRQNKIVVEGKIWHRTGDAGSISKDGKLFLAGRAKQAFIYHGKWIYPFLFESFCNIVDGVVMGTLMPSNNKVVAVIELEKGVEKASIETIIKTSKFTVHQVIFQKHIPRDPRHFSKIDYDELRKLVSKI
ncbi:MAG: AMP-binding protein [Bacteroidia bacterium]